MTRRSLVSRKNSLELTCSLSLTAIPRSLALLSRLLYISGTSPTMHALVSSEHARISLIQANLIALFHRPSALPPPNTLYSESTFPLPLPPLLNRSQSSSTTSDSAESLYSLASKVTASAEAGFPSPLGYSPYPLPAQTDGLSPSAFVLSLPPPITLQGPAGTKPSLSPLILSSRLEAAALTLPSPPQDDQIEEKWKEEGKGQGVMSPLEMIRRVLGRGKRASGLAGGKRRR